MPELPEVETICRQMEPLLRGAVILDVTVRDAKLHVPKDLVGRTVRTVRRTGKEVGLVLGDGRVIRIHLRMSGHLLWNVGREEPPHTRCILSFDRGRLLLADPRRFATLSVHPDSTAEGVPDPLEGLNAPALVRAAKGRRLPAKAFLLDQKSVGGIGNIYACEILHRAKINPWKTTGQITRREWDRVRRAARSVLKKAVDGRGTTISDWTDLFGRKGTYQNHLSVYGREGEPCPRCGAPVARRVMGGRGTYYCPDCQGRDEKGGLPPSGKNEKMDAGRRPRTER